METFTIKEVITIPFVETLGKREQVYYKTSVLELFKNHVKENNVLWESVIIEEQESYEQTCLSPETRIGIVIKYRGRKRTEDDEQRERIEFMIKNIS